MIYPIEKNTDGSINWTASAASHDNTRLSRSIIGTAQVLSSAFLYHGHESTVKPISTNHAFHLWIVESSINIRALHTFGYELCNQFRLRYGKVHKCLDFFKDTEPVVSKIKDYSNAHSTFPLAMPQEFKTDDVVDSYRNFWVSKEKMKYPKNKVPQWFKEMRKIPYEVVL